MRLYSFVNGMYLNSLQHGIQTGHAAVRIAMLDNVIAREWACNHETFIILDARNYAGLVDITKKLSQLIHMYNLFLKDQSQSIPYVVFNEDDDSLGGLQTCFACVLPEDFYDTIPKLKRDEAAEIVEKYWFGVKKFHAMAHTTEKYRNLIICTLKAYNLVGV